MSRSIAMALTLACAAWLPLPGHAAEKWFLMSRHGECAQIASLKRKVPDLGAIDEPGAFVEFMRKKGHQVIATQIPVPRGKGQDVKVPKMDLALVFVTSEMCAGPAKPR